MFELSLEEIHVDFLLDLSRRLRWHCGSRQSTDGVSLVHRYKRVLMVSLSAHLLITNDSHKIVTVV